MKGSWFLFLTFVQSNCMQKHKPPVRDLVRSSLFSYYLTRQPFSRKWVTRFSSDNDPATYCPPPHSCTPPMICHPTASLVPWGKEYILIWLLTLFWWLQTISCTFPSSSLFTHRLKTKMPNHEDTPTTYVALLSKYLVTIFPLEKWEMEWRHVCQASCSMHSPQIFGY